MTSSSKPQRHSASAALLAVSGVACVAASTAFASQGALRSPATGLRGSVAGVASGGSRFNAAGQQDSGSSFCFVPTAAVAAMVAVAGSAARRSARASRRSKEDDDAEDGFKGALAVSMLAASVPIVMDSVAISKVLPHRYPFLLVDKVVEFIPGKKAVGVKNVTANEPQFTGHFPDRPIMPGVLMVEAMAQLGGIICLQQPVTDGKGDFFFAGIEGVKFRKPVVPGDTLVMEMELLKFKAKYGIAKMKGRAYVDGKLAVEVAEFTFAMVKPTAPEAEAA